jgi:hypothetical protein
MVYPRAAALSLFGLALVVSRPSSAQSVVSTHSGLLYYFEGSVFVGDQPVEQKFGRFPDIEEGRELRTAGGRAEVLLTPGVFLRLDEQSSIRMLSNRLSDTRVELLGGSAIFETGQPMKNTSVKLIYKEWQVSASQPAVYRIDAEPPKVQVYKGEIAVARVGGNQATPVSVRETQVLPLAPVLVAEDVPVVADGFKSWATGRSRAVAADDEVAARIADAPSDTDIAGFTTGGFTYFPVISDPYLGILNPYGVSFSSPYQSTLLSSCMPSYVYGFSSVWLGGPCYYPTFGILGTWPRTGTNFGSIRPPRPPARPLPIRPLPVAPRPIPPPHVTRPVIIHH